MFGPRVATVVRECPMIWRLPHPIRGLVAFVAVWWAGGAMLAGFGAGLPELVALTCLATGALALASRRTSSERAEG